jgi:hypothetical protein
VSPWGTECATGLTLERLARLRLVAFVIFNAFRSPTQQDYLSQSRMLITKPVIVLWNFRNKIFSLYFRPDIQVVLENNSDVMETRMNICKKLHVLLNSK